METITHHVIDNANCLKTTHCQNIVIVDDDSLWKEYIRRFIDKCANHYQIFDAKTLQEASDIIDCYEIDIAMFDLNLPDAWSTVTLEFCEKISGKFPIAIFSHNSIDIKLGVKKLPNIYCQILKQDIDFEKFQLIYQFLSKEREILTQRWNIESY